MEQMYKLYSIDPQDLIDETVEHCEKLQILLDEMDGWGTGLAEELAEFFNMECHSDNTYNDTDSTAHLKNGLQWHVLSNDDDYLYDSNAIVLIEMHLGGDIRGNYGTMKAYRCSKYSTPADILCRLYVDPSEISEEEETA